LAVLTEQGVEGRGVKVATVLFGEREQAAEAVRLLAVVVSVVEVEAADYRRVRSTWEDSKSGKEAYSLRVGELSPSQREWASKPN
jgi:hypothetical protein